MNNSDNWWIQHAKEVIFSRAKRFPTGTGVALSSLIFALPQVALAQGVDPKNDTDASNATAALLLEEIVVTGTLLRGIAPVGAQTFVFDAEEMAATGRATTSQILSQLPQGGEFSREPAVRGESGAAISINRPSLRNLGNEAASASSTLLLHNGHRLPGMGITQTGPDLDAIPSGAIERIEIVPDGGSAIYGSDAIGGVVNLITRKSFDGVSISARQGFADNYSPFDTSIIAGRDWDKISAFIAYDYVKTDKIFGRDRDWYNGLDWRASTALGYPVGNDLACSPGTVQVGGINYALPDLTTDPLNLGNRCDLNQAVTIHPSQERHSVFGQVTVDNGGPASYSVSAFYTDRENISDAGPLRNSGSFTVASSSPFYRPVMPGDTSNQGVFFNLAPITGNSTDQTNTLETYGITPSVKVDLHGDWQLNAFANYGKSEAEFRSDSLNVAPINTAIAAGTFNPYEPTATINTETLKAARDWVNYSWGENEMYNARVVVDGPVFSLPGGDVRIALGGEYLHEKFSLVSRRGVTAAGISSLPVAGAKRRSESFFGEVNIPIIGEDNRGIVHSLSLTVAGRYDDYSDFGETSNPQYSITFEPVKWMKLRAKYGESFQAPSLNDIAGATVSSANFLPFVPDFFADPDVPALPGQSMIFFGGTIEPLSPQTAKTYSYGIDMDVPFVEDLSLGATYYNIEFKGLVDSAPLGTGNLFYDNFQGQYRIYPQGLEAMQEYLNFVRSTVDNPQGLPTSAENIYVIIDQRRQNLAGVSTDGIDFYLRYQRDTDVGRIFFNFNGNYILNFERQLSDTAPFVEIKTGKEVARLRATTTLGIEVGNLLGQVTWNYTEGHPVDDIVYGQGLVQSSVDAFNVYNLFFKYEVPGRSSMLEDLSLTLNVDNLFDEDPPLFRGAQGVANGSTLGRVVRFGVSKRF